MTHPLTHATTYIETYCIRLDNGRHEVRSHATGFFVRTAQALLLVTNWHVVTGLDPAKPSLVGKPSPLYMKLTVASKAGQLNELTLPLYDSQMLPLWEEHPHGPAVDIVIYPLPLSLENHFSFVDIQSAVDVEEIDETVAKDVFILGYPFGKDEMKASFGEDVLYFFPVWKRGSIATEPAFRIDGRTLLIDSLSRPGMSGAPVLIAQEEPVMKVKSTKNASIFKQLAQREIGALDAMSSLDVDDLMSGMKKRFNLLGVYSGVIGNTRLAEIALGKCWHVETLRELSANSQNGRMPFHSPSMNKFYGELLALTSGGRLIRKNKHGEVVDNVRLGRIGEI